LLVLTLADGHDAAI